MIAKGGFLLTARVLLACTVVALGLMIARLTSTTTSTSLLKSHALQNLESVVGLAFLLLAACSVTGKPELDFRQPEAAWKFALMLMLPLGAAFAATLHAPLLYDAYGQISRAATEPFRHAVQEFWSHPTVGDFFYRPLGRIAFSLDYRWAGFHPLRWHLWSLAIHLLNSTLVYMLCGYLRFTRTGASAAALLFAFHGSRPEVVAWTAGRFDLLVAALMLASLLLLLRYAIQGRTAALVAAAIFAALAMVTKEEAYCLPLLAWILILFRPDLKKGLTRGGAVLAIVTTALFLYRLWVLGGIGGYADTSGERTVLAFHALRSADLLLLRLWALLLFPTNWSILPGLLFQLGLCLYVIALATVAFYARLYWPRLVAALALTLAAMLPAQHLLGIGPDLLGARILYVPSIGFALLLSLLIENCPNFVGLACAVVLLGFQIFQLEHNLFIWRGVADLSKKTCEAVGEELARSPAPIQIADVPNTLRGIYFLRDAFPDCVRVNSGHETSRLLLGPHPTGSNARHFIWNDALERFQEVR